MKGSDFRGQRLDWRGRDELRSRTPGLIMEAQHAEHYEMAGYGSAHAYAELLGDMEAANLLKASLEEERGANEKLNYLSTAINVAALNSKAS